MAVVKEDLARSHSITSQTWRNTIVRTFHVTGLVQPARYQMMEALDDPAIPDYLDPYPFSATPEFPEYETVRVRNRRAEPNGENAALVVVTYDNDSGTGSSQPEYPPVGQNDGPDIRQISFTTVETETILDKDDNIMLVSPPPSVTNQPNLVSIATGRKVVGEIVFERTERTDPVARMRQYTNKINSASLGSGTYAAKTVYFQGVETSGNTNDGYRCRYTFSYDSEGFTHRDAWRDPVTGVTPTDAVYVTFDLFEEINFDPLGFNWDDP